MRRESVDSLAHAVELTTKLIALGVTLCELALEPMHPLTKLDESRVGLRLTLHGAATPLTVLFLQQAAHLGELVSQLSDLSLLLFELLPVFGVHSLWRRLRAITPVWFGLSGSPGIIAVVAIVLIECT